MEGTAVVRLLGPLDVVDAGGASHPIPGRRSQCLLALLTVAAGRTLSADALIDAVWIDGLPSAPAAALQTQVFRLRKLLRFPGAPEVRTSSSGYSLALGDARTDAGELEALLTRAATVAPTQAVDLLDRALALWRGLPFDGLEEVDELRAEQQRLEELHAQTIERHADALIDSGCANVALARLEAFTVANPIRPHATASLMRAYVDCGRDGDAMRAFERHRRELAEQLGIDPSPELRTLERTLFDDRAAAVATADERAPAVPRGIGLERLTFHRAPVPGAEPLAWAELGSGPPVIVVPAWVSHLGVIAAGRDPRSPLIELLAATHRVITYDRRGTGLSPGEITDHGLDAAVAELATIVDRVDGPVDLVGISGSGPISIAYAARHPDRVGHLALFGTYANGPKTLGELGSPLLELLELRPRLAYEWLAELYRPGASAAATQALVSVLRESAPRETVTAYLRAIFETDVSAIAAQLTTPTVILHYRRDRVMPFAGGEDLAALVPRATFVPLEGRWHAPDARDVPEVVEVIDALFLGEPADRRGTG